MEHLTVLGRDDILFIIYTLAPLYILFCLGYIGHLIWDRVGYSMYKKVIGYIRYYRFVRQVNKQISKRGR